MPLRLIGFILFILVIFAFIGFNLDNHTDINIWVNEKGHYEDVSVIVVVFAAYLFGLFSTVPFWFARSMSKKKKNKTRNEKKEKTTLLEELPPEKLEKTEKTKKRKLLPRKDKTLEEKNS